MSKSPLPDGILPRCRDEYLAHDETCLSLPYMWLGRKGGVTCPSDLLDCDDCEHTFYLEGVTWVNFDVPEDELVLCACCAQVRGYTVQVSAFGVTTTGT